MRSLVKKRPLFIRLTSQEAADVERAARIESRRRGELVGRSTLVRELAMPRVREIVAADPALQAAG